MADMVSVFSQTAIARDCFTRQAWSWTWHQGNLTRAEPVPDDRASPPDPSRDESLFAGPALCDPQINGGFGLSFGEPGDDPERLLRFMRRLRAKGIAWILPTLITDTLPRLENALRKLERHRQAIPGWDSFAPGYHLEGPWISPEDGYRGAHPREAVTRPDVASLVRLHHAANGRLKLLTLAPEIPGAIAVIEKARELGIRVALGHTSADAATIAVAVQAGATLSTHLGNGLPSHLPRHHNPIWPQLAHDGLTASFIPDGHHLPWPLIDCLLRCKGHARAIITADSSPVAGLPPGRYRIWNAEVEIDSNGRVGLPGSPLLAGSGCFTDHCVRQLAASGLVPLETALSMASIQTATLLGLPVPWDPKGGTLVLFRGNSGNIWEPCLVSIAGEWQEPVTETELD